MLLQVGRLLQLDLFVWIREDGMVDGMGFAFGYLCGFMEDWEFIAKDRTGKSLSENITDDGDSYPSGCSIIISHDKEKISVSKMKASAKPVNEFKLVKKSSLPNIVTGEAIIMRQMTSSNPVVRHDVH